MMIDGRGRKSHRQIVIETVKANPGLTSEEISYKIKGTPTLVQNCKFDNALRRKCFPDKRQVRFVCQSTPEIQNKGNSTYAAWVWVEDKTPAPANEPAKAEA